MFSIEIEDQKQDDGAIVIDFLGLDSSKVVPGASFVDDLGADSLDHVELVMECDEQFGIEISDDDADKIKTVGEAERYLNEHIE